MDESANNGKGYIHDDIQSKPFVWFTVIFIVFCVASVVLVTFLYKGLSKYHDENQAAAPTLVESGPAVPPEPQLQADPVKDMKAMDAAQMQLLASYGWVDKEKGIARIPIDKAIELTLEHSLVRAQVPAAAAATGQGQ